MTKAELAKPGAAARRLAEQVARRCGFTLAQIVANDPPSRTKAARHEVILALSRTGKYSAKAISEMVGMNPSSAGYVIHTRSSQNQARLAELRRRLAPLYGPEDVDNIMADKDPSTNADLAAWRSLGR